MEEILFWNKLNSAYASFCVDTLRASKSGGYAELATALVGDELEWCNTDALLSMTALQSSLQKRIPELEQTLKESERQLSFERETSCALRKQIKSANITAEDTMWELQEQLAHATNTMQIERDTALKLREQLEATQAKLVEVEMYLTSERGSVALQLEEELATAKLRIAELEEDKDDLEMKIKDRKLAPVKVQSLKSSNHGESFAKREVKAAAALQNRPRDKENILL